MPKEEDVFDFPSIDEVGDAPSREETKLPSIEKEIPSDIVKKVKPMEETEHGDLTAPSTEDALREFSKSMARSVLEFGATTPTKMGNVPFIMGSAFPDAAITGPSSLVLKPSENPVANKIQELSRVTRELNSDFIASKRQEIHDIKGLKPSERTEKLLAAGFDTSDGVFTSRNVERAGQLFANSFGSLAFSIGTGSILGTAVPAVLFGMSEIETKAQEGKEAEVSEQNQAISGITMGVATYWTEKIGLDWILGKAGGAGLKRLAASGVLPKLLKNKLFKKALASPTAHVSVRALEGMSGEGGTEALQELISNTISKHGYGATKGYLDGVVDAFVGGALSGTSASAAMTTASELRRSLELKGMTKEETEAIRLAASMSFLANSEAIDNESNRIINDRLRGEELLRAKRGRNLEGQKSEQIARFADFFQGTRKGVTAEEKATERAAAVSKLTRDKENARGIYIMLEEAGLDPNEFSPRERLAEAIKLQKRKVQDTKKGKEPVSKSLRGDKAGDGVTRTTTSGPKTQKTVTDLELGTPLEQEEGLGGQTLPESDTFVTDIQFSKMVDNVETDKLKELTGITKIIQKGTPENVRNDIIAQLSLLRGDVSAKDIGDVARRIEAIIKRGKEKNVFLEKSNARLAMSRAHTFLVSLFKSDKNILTRKQKDEGKAQMFNIQSQSLARVLDGLDGTGDGSGAGNAIFTETLTDAENGKLRDELFVKKAVKKILKDAKLTVNRLLSKTVIDGLKFSLEERMYLWAIRRSPDNLHAVVFGNNIDVSTVRKVHDSLTPTQKATADKLAKLYRYKFTELNESVIKNSKGKRYLQKVPGTYITIERKRLSLIQRAIGRKSGTPEDAVFGNIEKNLTDENDIRIANSKDRARLKENPILDRTLGDSKIQSEVRMDLLGGLFRHTELKAKYIHYASTIRELRQVLDMVLKDVDINGKHFNRISVKDMITRHKKGGQAALAAFEQDFATAVDDGLYLNRDPGTVFVDTLRQKAIIPSLGAKARTVAIQWPSMVLAFQHMRNPVRLLARIAALPVIAGNPWHMHSLMRFVNAKDAEMETRTFDFAIEQMRRQNPTKYKRAIDKVGEAALFGITAMDRLVVYNIWKAVYDDVMANNNIPAHKRETEAIRTARRVIKRTQPGSKLVDLPLIYSSGATRVMTLFGGQLAKLQMIATRDAPRMVVDGIVNKDALKAYQGVMAELGVLTQAMLVFYIVHGFFPSDQEDVVSFSRNALAWTMPLGLGPQMSSVAQGFGGAPSGLIIPTAAATLLKRSTIKEKEAAALTLAGAATQLPLSGMKRIYDGAQQFLEEHPDDFDEAMAHLQRGEGARALGKALEPFQGLIRSKGAQDFFSKDSRELQKLRREVSAFKKESEGKDVQAFFTKFDLLK